MPRSCPDGCRLLHGPYHAPPLRVGDREACLVRDCLCAVTGYSAGRIPWPMGVAVGGRSAPGFIVNEELARAVRSEAAKALRWWFGVGVKVVWKWRKALGVTKTNNPGTNALVRKASEKGASKTRGRPLSEGQVEKRRRTALELGLGRYLRPDYHGYLGQRWTEDELALLGALPDEDVAARVGRSVTAVRVKRNKLKLATAQDRRRPPG